MLVRETLLCNFSKKLNNLKKNILVFLFCSFLTEIVAQQLHSPPKNITFKFSLPENGTPVYEIMHKDKKVIETSKLKVSLTCIIHCENTHQ